MKDHRRDGSLTPAQLRQIFGQNLRELCREAPSISALCRTLGINRTQFNRYLSGESFPRPDILYRICTHFAVDARILLEPVADLRRARDDLLHHPELHEFVSSGTMELSPEVFPSGFFSFSRQSFIDENAYVIGLVHVYRRDGFTFIRGFEPRSALARQGLPDDVRAREYRGFLIPQEGGVAVLVSRRNSMTCSFSFLSRVPSFENNFWEGYTARTVREGLAGRRVTRLAYEHLPDFSQAMAVARKVGFCRLEDLPPYHRTLLRAGKPFR